MTLTLEGDANDYVGKGLSGGCIVVSPPKESRFASHENIIIGNVCLYGATGGQLFVRGVAAERFAVRNSGAHAVVEGCGDHGCEHMTGGVVVVLGSTGRNFAAGMSGGLAFVYDPDGAFALRCNQDMVDLEPLVSDEDKQLVLQLLKDHVRLTQSSRAQEILDSDTSACQHFVKVYPQDYRRAIEARQQHQQPEVVKPSTNQAHAEVSTLQLQRDCCYFFFFLCFGTSKLTTANEQEPLSNGKKSTTDGNNAYPTSTTDIEDSVPYGEQLRVSKQYVYLAFLNGHRFAS